MNSGNGERMNWNEFKEECRIDRFFTYVEFSTLSLIGEVFSGSGKQAKNYRSYNINENEFWDKYLGRGTTNLRGGYVNFWMFNNSQAYAIKFAHYYWFVKTWNLWNFQGSLWIISWDIQILNKKKDKSKKVSCVLDLLGLDSKLA